MKLKSVFLLVIIIPVVSCSSTKRTSSKFGNSFSVSIPKPTDDGLSYITAIVITEKLETTGTKAEYEWIKNNYSNYKVKGQSLNNRENKPFDVITIVLSDGKELPLYFDISNFFGKF
ncbi:MAG: hypothetical protein ACRYFR_15850 [Janthinobacterium lividum]